MAKKNKALVAGVSKWEGGLLSYIFTFIKMVLALAITVGLGAVILTTVGDVVGIIAIAVLGLIGFCWAEVIFIKWDTKKTIISGQRLKFTASTFNLFLNILKWTVLTIITVGIYALWLPFKYRKWQIKNTVAYTEGAEEVAEDEEDEEENDGPIINYYEYDDEEEDEDEE